jgi:MoaA/NifB/PqqE/SkfB family radical SAM enzyme
MCFAKHRHSAKTPLTFKLLRRILSELVGMGVLEVRFTGGEPTVFRRFLELVAQANDGNMNVSVNTHGAYDERMLRQLATSAIREFNISLDGPPSVHDKLRGQGVFERAVRAILVLRDAGKHVRINTMVFRENLDSLTGMLALAEELAVDIRFCPMRSIGGDKARLFANAHGPSHSQWAQAKRQLEQIAPRASVRVLYHSSAQSVDCGNCEGPDAGLEQANCAAWLTQLGIDPEGDAYPGGCIDDIPKSMSVGSIAELSVKDLWARAVRDANERLMHQFPRCAGCEPAELWQKWRNHLDAQWARSNHLF